MNVGDLFAIPLFMEKILLDDSKVEESWKLVNWNYPQLISFDMDLLDTHFSFLMPQISDFVRKVMDMIGFSGVDFYIFSSWGTITPPNMFSSYHKHTNSFMSGVIYFSDETSPILFENPFQMPYSHIANQSSPSELTKYTKSRVGLSPKKGDVIMFSSMINHMISPNSFSEDRKSIAFNVVPIGTYGEKDCKITLHKNNEKTDS